MSPEDIDVGEWYYVVQEGDKHVGYAVMQCAGIQIDEHGMRPIFSVKGGDAYLPPPCSVHEKQSDARAEIIARSLTLFQHSNAPKERPR